MTTTLVLGGVRSGKSRHAESLLDGAVTYVATSAPADPTDERWAARVEAHRVRRPATWTTVESLDLVGVLAAADGPVLIDCLGVWLTRTIDELDGWEDPTLSTRLTPRVDDLVAAWGAASGAAHPVVAVSNEVGLGVVPPMRSGQLFRDELGRLNARLSAVSTSVHLVVAGRALDLSNAPVVS